jgi:hypothetical protein
VIGRILTVTVIELVNQFRELPPLLSLLVPASLRENCVFALVVCNHRITVPAEPMILSPQRRLISAASAGLDELYVRPLGCDVDVVADAGAALVPAALALRIPFMYASFVSNAESAPFRNS